MLLFLLLSFLFYADALLYNRYTIADISCGEFACVARKNDGTAEAWGDAGYGGDASSVDLTDVADISCGGTACVARKTDGSAVAWGDASLGGNAPSLTDTYSQATPAQLRRAMNDQNCRI